VTVVADAGMVSKGNQKAIEAAGLSFILGARVPDVPYVVKAWRDAHPDQQVTHGAHLHPALARRPHRPGRRDHTIYYQYRHDRADRAVQAGRTLRGIDWGSPRLRGNKSPKPNARWPGRCR